MNPTNILLGMGIKLYDHQPGRIFRHTYHAWGGRAQPCWGINPAPGHLFTVASRLVKVTAKDVHISTGHPLLSLCLPPEGWYRCTQAHRAPIFERINEEKSHCKLGEPRRPPPCLWTYIYRCQSTGNVAAKDVLIYQYSASFAVTFPSSLQKAGTKVPTHIEHQYSKESMMKSRIVSPRFVYRNAFLTMKPWNPSVFRAIRALIALQSFEI